MEYTLGRIKAYSMAIGETIKSPALVFTNGTMAESMKGIGLKMICMVKVCISGQMEDHTKAASNRTRKTDMEFTRTQTAAVTKECGTMDSNTVMAYLCHRKENNERASGTLVRGCNGLMARILPARTQSNFRNILETKGFRLKASEGTVRNQTSSPSRAPPKNQSQ